MHPMCAAVSSNLKSSCIAAMAENRSLTFSTQIVTQVEHGKFFEGNYNRNMLCRNLIWYLDVYKLGSLIVGGLFRMGFVRV